MGKMSIYVLFAQRDEDYEGQYGPEAHAVSDSWTVDEVGTEWLEDEQKKVEQDGEIVSTAIVKINVDQETIRGILLPPVVVDGIAGEIEIEEESDDE